MSTVGVQIRDRRRQLGLTQAALGRLVGISREMVAFYEVGMRVPSRQRLECLNRALDTVAGWRDQDNGAGE